MQTGWLNWSVKSRSWIDKPLKALSPLQAYLVVTGNYWGFTLTDGALRMLVVLYFYGLGYSAFDVAMLFVLYELFGVITNLVGGWIGARIGLNRTMNVGLALQLIALSMLLVPADWLSVIWVMAAQALSGIAKDLNKMSAKSSIKGLAKADALFGWVSALTGSKNALKGFGFFLGGALLGAFGFRQAIWILLIGLTVIWLISLLVLNQDLGKAKTKPKFNEIFSDSPAINQLAAARMFLFGARDVWFVVALPVFLSEVLNWSPFTVGSTLAGWVIGYGLVQATTPKLLKHTPGKASALWAVGTLLGVTAVLALIMEQSIMMPASLLVGLALFGIALAFNSSIHSFLIVAFARDEGTSMDVGFYYMANAMGRLLGTLLSGAIYQIAGLAACLATSALLLILAMYFTQRLPDQGRY